MPDIPTPARQPPQETMIAGNLTDYGVSQQRGTPFMIY